MPQDDLIFFMQSIPGGLNVSACAGGLDEFETFGELVSAVAKLRKGDLTVLLAADGYESNGWVPDHQLASPQDTLAEDFIAGLEVLGVYDDPELLLARALGHVMFTHTRTRAQRRGY